MMKIEIASNHEKAEEFRAWLCSKGLKASIGVTPESSVDGVRTSKDKDAGAIFNTLWDKFCSR